MPGACVVAGVLFIPSLCGADSPEQLPGPFLTGARGSSPGGHPPCTSGTQATPRLEQCHDVVSHVSYPKGEEAVGQQQWGRTWVRYGRLEPVLKT